ncbi:MAG: metallophosphoesterase family protein [Bacteroidales bacterium]
MNALKVTLFCAVLLFVIRIEAQQPPRKDNQQQSIFQTVVPSHNFDVIAARPTTNAITLSVLFYKSASIYVEYWIANEPRHKSEVYRLAAFKPQEIVLLNLKPDTRYKYQIRFQLADNEQYLSSKTSYFQTARKSNRPFAFTITADSHLDQNADTAIYKTTLLNAASDSADFHFDLGDTFMTDKYRDQYKDAFSQYVAQRYYLGLLCNSAALFFVLGNHDGETGQRLNGTENNSTVWSNLTRKTYFPNPLPDDFYSGNTHSEPFVGLPQDYYAFEWGNAQFIVLDPFWFTPRAGNDNPWERTLGKTQYEWLKSTLEKSKASFRFVFIHNLVGGADVKGKARGGAEIAGFYEWGGKNQDGTDGFKQHRLDWEMPIHDLLRKYRVTAVFHGHDHLFAKQEKDGIIYQCISQPGSMRTRISNQGTEYGYTTDDAFLNAGYMRVSVLKNKARFDFVSTNIDEPAKNKRVIYTYELKK